MAMILLTNTPEGALHARSTLTTKHTQDLMKAKRIEDLLHHNGFGVLAHT